MIGLLLSMMVWRIRNLAPKTNQQRYKPLRRAIYGETPPMRALELVLRALEWLSIGHWSAWLLRRHAWDTGRVSDETIWRYWAGCVLDGYIAVWFFAEVALLLLGLHHIAGTVIIGAATYRLVEITQVFANGVLFDIRRSMRAGVRNYMLVSLTRSVVHSIVLLIETIFCFAIIYAAVGPAHITGVAGGQDAVDASIRTMTTVGTQAQARGAFRLVVDVEPLIGLLFAATVLARLVNAMPAVRDTEANLDQLLELLREEELDPDRIFGSRKPD